MQGLDSCSALMVNVPMDVKLGLNHRTYALMGTERVIQNL